MRVVEEDRPLPKTQAEEPIKVDFKILAKLIKYAKRKGWV